MSAQNGNMDDKLGSGDDFGAHMERIRTAGSVNISAELFEKLYLSPQNAVKGELRQTFGNPTPIALGGFLLSLTPLSMTLLEWRGSGGLGAAMNGAYFYFGGMLLLLGGVGEWILGNNFPATVFMTFGSFWFTFGATLTPFYNASAPYSPDPAEPQLGASSAQFMATYAFFLTAMGLLCLVYLIASIRTNLVFFLIFLFIVPAFGCLAGSFWQGAQGNATLAKALQHAGGGLALVVSLLGWYIFFALVLAGVDFPFTLPVIDLSTTIKGKSEKEKARRHRAGSPA